MDKQVFRITIEHFDEKCVIEKDHSDLDIYEVADLLRQAVLGCGFSEELVNEILPES